MQKKTILCIGPSFRQCCAVCLLTLMPFELHPDIYRQITHLLGSFHVDHFQAEWRIDIARQLEIIQVEGSNYPKIEEDLIRRRKDELRLDIVSNQIKINLCLFDGKTSSLIHFSQSFGYFIHIFFGAVCLYRVLVCQL